MSQTRRRATRACARAGGPGRHWSPAIGAEALATRTAAGLFDESSFAKLEVSGPGAAQLLERLCDNRIPDEVGRITYTQMLNRRGGIECDFTVTRRVGGPRPSRSSPAPRSATTTPPGSAATCPTTAR